MSLKENFRYGRTRRFRHSRWEELIHGTALNGIEFATLMPSQWFAGPAETGERLLLISVLATAIDDICRRKEPLLKNIETWLTESEHEATSRIPFPRLCSMLQIDEEYCRSKLTGYIDQVRDENNHRSLDPEAQPHCD